MTSKIKELPGGSCPQCFGAEAAEEPSGRVLLSLWSQVPLDKPAILEGTEIEVMFTQDRPGGGPPLVQKSLMRYRVTGTERPLEEPLALLFEPSDKSKLAFRIIPPGDVPAHPIQSPRWVVRP